MSLDISFGSTQHFHDLRITMVEKEALLGVECDLRTDVFRAQLEVENVEIFFNSFFRDNDYFSLRQPAQDVIAQGAKRAHLGNEVFSYDPGSYLLYNVDLPLVFHAEDATPEKP